MLKTFALIVMIWTPGGEYAFVADYGLTESDCESAKADWLPQTDSQAAYVDIVCELED